MTLAPMSLIDASAGIPIYSCAVGHELDDVLPPNVGALDDIGVDNALSVEVLGSSLQARHCRSWAPYSD